MSLAKVFSAQNVFLTATIITIEVDLSKGLNAFSIVGLPDKAVEESKDRVAAAIKNSGFTSPKIKNQKVVVSLSPANLKKEGPLFDLAIALSYLLASGEINFDPEHKLFLGELSLDGTLHPLRGILPLVEQARKEGFREIYLPEENAREAALLSGVTIYGAASLAAVIAHINEKKGEKFESLKWQIKIKPQEQTLIGEEKNEEKEIDLAEIKGQESAKRGLEIAAAGGHNVAIFGPPGTGKTMLAKAFALLLPPLSFEEILEITTIHSLSPNRRDSLVTKPPFRAPHHSASPISITGGGTNPRPGEITLAHRGVLFLDEFPEFDRRVIEALRQPLEEKVVVVARAKQSVLFPADFILIAAMNPCPCGNAGIAGKECICNPREVSRYQRKISGPIMDRIDIWLEVSKVDYKKLGEVAPQKKQETKIAKERVKKARLIQIRRYQEKNLPIQINSHLQANNVVEILHLPFALQEKYNTMAQTLDLSARAYHRVLKLARTIADLEESPEVTEAHILEALQYRPKITASF